MNTFYSVILFIAIQNVADGGIRIRVDQGWLEGEILDLVTGDGQYSSFKGIPYAQPPNGTRRFKAPLTALGWDGVRNASQHGAMCPQIDIFTNKLIPGNEDCLFLNVYSPNLTPETLLPVLVFIHGGGYKSGSGNVDDYGPDFILRKNMVVVTFNYRLDALGFLSLGTKEVPGNAGLKDQVEALKWVQRNIKHFGGDADRVTIMGQSAGSASVGLHIVSPMSQGLFHRAIAMSGSPFCDWSLAFNPERRAFVLGKTLGFVTEDPEELLEFHQSVPSDKLRDTSPNILSFEEYTYNLLKMYQFVPVIEKFNETDNFLTYDIFKEFRHVNKVDILFGHTSQETLTIIDLIASTYVQRYDKYPELFVPRKLMNQLGPNHMLELSDRILKHYFGNKSVNVESLKDFIRYASNVGFIYDIIKYFSTLPFLENTVRFSYQFSSMSSRNVYGLQGEKYDIFGAAHVDDLFYLFDPKSLQLVSDRNSTEFLLIDQVTTIFTDFAIHGNPTHSPAFNMTWPIFDKKTLQFVDIGNENLTVSSMVGDDSYNFWEQLYDSTGMYI
ncbi:hypothetical protein PYW07_016198 [Mythimna separata]|uniref:Carboxylic ester hydrolase n=1 Tax=Mythimna separata TaxID=271217 RepID=A0AAD7YRZ5_MYTSE|nr:hypothetical protein PYW07_016198 [Mythimna separata]